MQTPGPARHDGRFLLGILPALALVLMVSAGSECAGGVALACTEIGCADGLSVRVTDQLPGPVTVRVAADGEEHTFTCDPAYACIGFFEGWSPVRVDVDVSWDGGSHRVRITPDYDLVYPNGRRCGAECRQGTVAVALP